MKTKTHAESLSPGISLAFVRDELNPYYFLVFLCSHSGYYSTLQNILYIRYNNHITKNMVHWWLVECVSSRYSPECRRRYFTNYLKLMCKIKLTT